MNDSLRYAGMTVNERLSAANLVEEFDRAVRQHNREQMLAILQKVEMTYEQAVYTADTILTDPSHYGY